MRSHTPIGRHRPSLGQLAVPGALLALVAMVAGLVVHTRRLEESHRTTAESALRDYAGFAAWQFNQHAESHLAATAHNTLTALHPWFRGSRLPLPAPDIVFASGDADDCMCAFSQGAVRAFRIDLPGRESTFIGAEATETERVLFVGRFADLAGAGEVSRETIRMFIDTLAGATRAVAYAVVRQADGTPRAVYGVEGDPSMVISHLSEIPERNALLPPSLLRGRSTGELLRVEITQAGGASLLAIGSEGSERFEAHQITSLAAGTLTTRIALRPDAASLLLIGGIPGSRLPVLLLLLAGSVVLAGVALFQLHRTRELNRLRLRFVANVSHELRTPLAQISMFSETLLLGRARSSAEGHQFLSIIFREARRLSNLVDSVLSFSRRDEGRLSGADRMPVAAIDVAHEVKDAVRAYAPLANALDVEIAVEVPNEPIVAEMEPGGLRQIVINLMDNAVKFGPEGQRVTVTVTRTNEQVRVSVSDQGPGIPISQRQRIFEPFAQFSSTASRTVVGAGIGLAVVADVVRRHGGSVRIDDGPGGKGATVSFAVPIRSEDRAPARVGSSSVVRTRALAGAR